MMSTSQWLTYRAFMSKVALLTTLVFLAGRVTGDSHCQSCDVFFQELQNRTGGSCRCIYAYSYSETHPQMIADCRYLTQLPRFSSICNMSDVHSVNVQYNDIQKLDNGAFSVFEISDKMLRWSEAKPEMILSNNHIDFIHPEAFGPGLESKLAHLYMRKNRLDSIPEALFRLHNLTLLDLSINGIVSSGIPKRLAFDKLKKLDLSSNQLTEFPSTLCRSPELQTLRLHKNPHLEQRDLSAYLVDLEKCRRLLYLSWPRPAMTCTFEAISNYANNSECKEMTVRFGKYEKMVCNEESSPQYRGETVDWVFRLELSKVCPGISGSPRTSWGIYYCLLLPLCLLFSTRPPLLELNRRNLNF